MSWKSTRKTERCFVTRIPKFHVNGKGMNAQRNKQANKYMIVKIK